MPVGVSWGVGPSYIIIYGRLGHSNLIFCFTSRIE